MKAVKTLHKIADKCSDYNCANKEWTCKVYRMAGTQCREKAIFIYVMMMNSF